MVRAALAQIFYKPAIVEQSVDHLDEPGLVQGGVSAASLRQILSPSKNEELSHLQLQIREDYITYFTHKLQEIIRQICRIHRPDLLLFPEYSVPYPCLPLLQSMARSHGMTIVAGSHTVLPAAEVYYSQAGLDIDTAQMRGSSIAPVFFPDGRADYQIKHQRSIFEVTMQAQPEAPFKRFRSVTQSGEPYSFYVVICADALYTETVGQLDLERREEADQNLMILTAACSTSTEGFRELSGQLARREIPMLICNNSRFGGSGIHLPPPIRERFTNPPGQPSCLGAGTEAVLLLDFLPGSYFVKRSVLDTDVRGSWSVCPVFYGKRPPWRQNYDQTLRDMEQALNSGCPADAAEHADTLLTLRENQLPAQLETAFRNFSALSGSLCADTGTCLLPLRCVLLPLNSTQAHLHREIQKVLHFCVDTGPDAVPLITALMHQQNSYPEEEPIPVQPVLPPAVAKPVPTEEENLEFRDRGAYMTQLEEAITNPAVRLILISGAYGIGKSSLTGITFRRNLPNWTVKYISLAPTTRFSMVLEYLANAIGHPLKADTLTRSSKNTLRPVLERFCKELLSKDGRAVVVDQMESILLGQQGRDHTLMTLFRDAVYGLKIGQGKVIFLSDVRFSKEIFPESPAVKRIVVGRISDNGYIKKILEYEIRRQGLLSPGQVPEIPSWLYSLVNGHPLTAKLCVDVMARRGIQSLEDISLDQMQEEVIRQLMEKICLDHLETQLMHLLSVFRTLIEVPRLKQHVPERYCNLLEENMSWLCSSSFISAGENTLEVTAVFRNYYYAQIPPEDRNALHGYALDYYVELHQELTRQHQFSAQVYAEIAYHLTQLGRMGELRRYLPGNLNTLKQLAKNLYQRDKNYPMALQLYQILCEAYPEDIEVLSYLGRCYARQGNWERVTEYFTRAVDAAQQQGEYTWYLYRDWGHMYVRYYMEPEAVEKFAEARDRLQRETGLSDEAGILAAEGFLAERNHDLSGAAGKYESALSCNATHEFTINNYASLLRRQGNIQYAQELEQRLLIADAERLGEPTDNFFSGFDMVDAEPELYED